MSDHDMTPEAGGDGAPPTGPLDPAKYVVLERDVYVAEREERESSRRLLSRAFIILAAALIGATIFGIYDRIQGAQEEEKRISRSETITGKLEDVTKDVDEVSGDLSDLTEVVEAVRRATSPEAQAEQAERLKGIITEVDCRNREALQQLADALERAGSSVSVTIRCMEPS